MTHQSDARLPQAGIILAEYTTWRVGGAAEWLAEPVSLDETGLDSVGG